MSISKEEVVGHEELETPHGVSQSFNQWVNSVNQSIKP